MTLTIKLEPALALPPNLQQCPARGAPTAIASNTAHERRIFDRIGPPTVPGHRKGRARANPFESRCNQWPLRL